MNNRDDSDNGRVYDDIPGGAGSESNRTSGRSSSVRNISGKTVNPAALTSSSSSGFAALKSTSNISKYSDPESDVNSSDIDNSKVYTLNSEHSLYENYDKNRTGNYTDGRTEANTDNRNAQHTYKSKKRKKRSARLPIVLMLTTLIFTVAICLSVLIISVGRDMLAIGKDGSLKMITISEGDDVKKVAQILEKEGIIDIPKAFEIVAKLSDADESFIPGQYELSPSYAYETIISKLTTEEIIENNETVNVTFLEGTSVIDAAKLLEENKVCDAERFIYYFNAGGYGFEFENKLPTSTASKFYRMEGYLFPDTYTFYIDSDPESVCMKIYQNFENKMTDEYYAQMQKKGMTLDEVITLASIVQAEAWNPESMKMVASVFENRLKNSDEFPKLQSDPTTYYVDEVIKPNIQIPSTAIFDAYDTYKGHGLPPGAIGNPGIDAIEAVLYPAETDYYYFAADIDTFEVFYAETLEEHEHNLAVINGQISNDDDYNYDDGEDDYE